MANLRVGTGVTLDGGTGNISVSGIITASGGGAVYSNNVGINTNSITNVPLVGAGNSFVGMYIGDGSLLFNNTLNRTGGYYISTETNALNAGPVTLDANMKIDGAWVIV